MDLVDIQMDLVDIQMSLLRFGRQIGRTLTASGDQVYGCALKATEDLSLRTDAIINVWFKGEDADADGD
jgi:hypothetical protein